MSSNSKCKVARYQFTTVQRSIATPIYLYPTALANTKPLATKAIWDTGAEMSVITPYIMKKLILETIDQIDISGAHGRETCDVVVLTLKIPGQDIFRDLQVAVCPFNPNPESDINVLIGMDIISRGDFVLSNGNGNTLFSFATPPSHNKIDLSELLL